MGKSNRREFLGELLDVHPAPSAGEDVLFEKYANKTLPKSNAKITGSLNPYSGPWTQAEVIHLLRRATFGLKPADIQTLLALSPAAAVDYLFSNAPSAAPAPPVNNYYSGYTDPTGVLQGQTWVNAAYGDGTVNFKRRLSLTAWWMGLILNQNCSILEKMTWFWHNHFSTEVSVIGDARTAYVHHAMLRANALGNFKTLVSLVTKDPGMLIYLNGYVNSKTAPDENYGRELQELFTVSKFNTPNYIEDDVKAAARVLTGWQIDNTTFPPSSKFTSSRHDTTNKQFSAFYNNTVITGQSGGAGAGETDALINMIFTAAATQTATWICTKLYRFFVYYDTVTDATVQAVISGMASTLIANSWNVVPVVKQLLKSQHFFDVNSRACYIRTPLDYYAGIYRAFGITLPGSFDEAKTYSVWNSFRQFAADNGLDLGEPPNVSGFPAYYQTPQFYELWINSNTYPKRLQFVDTMLNNGFRVVTGTYIAIDVLAFGSSYSNVADPDMLVQYCCDLLMGLDPSSTRKDALKGILLSGQTANHYWSDAWANYIANPTNATYKGIVKTRITSLLTEIMHSEEHQLA